MGSNNALAGLWTSLPDSLTPWILDVINSMGYERMTPVQASTIPLFMKHKDVVVEAVTGSGKTLSFVVPIIEKLVRRKKKLRRNEIGALVISPTRELATQIYDVFKSFLDAMPVDEPEEGEPGPSETPGRPIPDPLLLISSSESSPKEDIRRFLETGSDIVIGTPGRVEEFLLGKGQDVVGVKDLEILVMDEADRLLDLGFTQCLSRILTALPKQRRTGLFSATMNDALSEIVRVGLRNPVRVVVKVETKKKKDGKIVKEQVEERRIPATLKNYYMLCEPPEKLVQLTRLLTHESSQCNSARFIVYFATCATVDYFYRILALLVPKVTFFSLHGHIPPSKRTTSLNAFRNHPSTQQAPSVLLCTDVAARGLDLPDVDCVIQFDPPVDPKQFSHRCGRTARAGREGRAWVLLGEKETGYVDFLSVRKIPLSERERFTPENETGLVDVEDPDVNSFLQRIRSIVLKDRDLHDKALKAFVSFVRAYSKHEAAYIFRIRDLDLVGVAKSFALLRLPKMPELKDVSRDRWENASIDWDTYAYADKTREAHRHHASEAANTSEAKEKRALERANRVEQKQRNAAWSKEVNRKSEKERRKHKKAKKKEWQKTAEDSMQTDIEHSSENHARGKRTKGGSDAEDEDDWDELAREERMAKKVKRGTVDAKAFDAEFSGL